MCAKKVAKKFRPLPGFARHFAFSETGQAGHTLRVCCFAPKIRCAHFGAPLANPAPSVPLKNTNSNANNWRICVFLRVTPMAPEPSLRPKSRACARLASARACGRRTANEVAFSVARETVRMTFARSHAARVPENGIWNRAANRAPAVAGEIISAQRPFRTHAVRNAGLCAGLKPHRARRDSQYHFSTHP